MRSLKRRALVAFGIAALTFSAILPAQAGPSQVVMNAGGCGGLGNSSLASGGYGQTTGCSGSARYLSGSASFSSGCFASIPGNWWTGNVIWEPIGCAGYVTALAGTHNLGYISTYHGWEATNTW